MSEAEPDPTVVSVDWPFYGDNPLPGTRVELSNGFVEIFDLPARYTLERPDSTRDQRIAAQAVVDYWRERHRRS